MQSVTLGRCLASAHARRAEEVLRLAEEFEWGQPIARSESSPLFFSLLVTVHLVRNDVVSAMWALKRWGFVTATDEAEDPVRAALWRIARCCNRCAYGDAFREALAARGEEQLGRWLLDHLAARHVHQRLTFFNEPNDMGHLAVGLGVTPADLEARLQRVREDELRRMGCEVAEGTCEKVREALSCMVQAGKAN